MSTLALTLAPPRSRAAARGSRSRSALRGRREPPDRRARPDLVPAALHAGADHRARRSACCWSGAAYGPGLGAATIAALPGDGPSSGCRCSRPTPTAPTTRGLEVPAARGRHRWVPVGVRRWRPGSSAGSRGAGGTARSAARSARCCLGSVVIYAFGVPWLMTAACISPLEQGLELGLYPFVIGDLLKLLAAAGSAPAAWAVMDRLRPRAKAAATGRSEPLAGALVPARQGGRDPAGHASGSTWRFEGLEHIPATGPAIVACNHLSYLDPLANANAVMKAGRRPRFLAKDDLFEIPVVGSAFRGADQIPVAPRDRRIATPLRAGRGGARRRRGRRDLPGGNGHEARGPSADGGQDRHGPALAGQSGVPIIAARELGLAGGLAEVRARAA